MKSTHIHLLVCVVLGLTGVAAMVLAARRGRRVGARLAFGLGGFVVLLYAVAFYGSMTIARFGEIANAATSLGRGTAQTEMVKQVVKLTFPMALLEPIGILMLTVGFGALARASDAQRRPAGAAAPTPPADAVAPVDAADAELFDDEALE